MENSKSIAIIDCSDVMNPSKNVNDLTEFSKKLGDALSGIGFAYLINTGVDLRKVYNLIVCAHLYELPRMLWLTKLVQY